MGFEIFSGDPARAMIFSVSFQLEKHAMGMISFVVCCRSGFQ